MEIVIPFLIAAILAGASWSLKAHQRRIATQMKRSAPASSASPVAEDSAEVRETGTTTSPTAAPENANTLRTIPTPLTLQPADASNASADAVRTDVMQHFDLKKAMLYSEILTPKF